MSLKDEVTSFGFALKGALLSFREKHVRFHGVSFLIVCLVNFVLDLSLVEWAITITCATAVMVAEVLNTAIEEIMDFIHPKKSPVVGKIKDLAAGAVFFAAIGALIVAGIVYIPKLIALF